MLDEAEKVVGRRIMAEMFLENHTEDLHLYGQGLAQNVCFHVEIVHSIAWYINNSCVDMFLVKQIQEENSQRALVSFIIFLHNTLLRSSYCARFSLYCKR